MLNKDFTAAGVFIGLRVFCKALAGIGTDGISRKYVLCGKVSRRQAYLRAYSGDEDTRDHVTSLFWPRYQSNRNKQRRFDQVNLMKI